MGSKRDRYGNPMYGAVHKAARKRFARRMDMGEVLYCWRPTCPRPHEPIGPRHWDLGHVDPELRRQFGPRWPEHPACNRATYAHLKARVKAADRFGGLPDPEPDNTADRCRAIATGRSTRAALTCRELRAPCPDADRDPQEAA